MHYEIEKTNLLLVIDNLQKEKNELQQQLEEEKRKAEILQFNYEEESITKCEIQVIYCIE